MSFFLTERWLQKQNATTAKNMRKMSTLLMQFTRKLNTKSNSSLLREENAFNNLHNFQMPSSNANKEPNRTLWFKMAKAEKS